MNTHPSIPSPLPLIFLQPFTIILSFSFLSHYQYSSTRASNSSSKPTSPKCFLSKCSQLHSSHSCYTHPAKCICSSTFSWIMWSPISIKGFVCFSLAAPPPLIIPRPADTRPKVMVPVPKGVNKKRRPIFRQGGKMESLDSETRCPSSTQYQLYPIIIATIIWGHTWTSKSILIHCDNTAVVVIIHFMRRLTLIPAQHQLIFWAAHILLIWEAFV